MPVDIASGEVSLHCEDIAVPGQIELTWERRYSSGWGERPAGLLGFGWFSPYEALLTPVPDQGFEFTTPEGEIEWFADPQGEVWQGGIVRQLGACLELFRLGDRLVIQQWNFESTDVRRYVFSGRHRAGAGWRLDAIENLAGRGVELDWTPEGRLLEVRQRTEHRRLTPVYGRHGFIEEVHLHGPDGQTEPVVHLEYHQDGRMASAADAAGFSDRWEYDGQGRLIREVAKDGGVITHRYDERGRCVLRTGLGHYNYKRLKYIDAVRTTELTDSHGSTWIYVHLPTGQAVLEVDPLGARLSTAYDEHQRVISRTSATGGITRFEYDCAGNRVAEIAADGARTEYRFDDNHQPLERRDALGQVWRREYDNRHLLSRTVDPLGQVWHFVHDLEACLVEITNPLGATRIQQFEHGVLRSATDWEGHATTYRYDVAGRIIEQRGALGEVTSFRYDPMGNPVLARLPDGSVIAATYDHAGNQTQYIDSLGHVTRWRYGPCGRLLESVDPVGGRVRFLWGTERDELLEVINEQEERYRFVYDPVGRVVEEVSFDGIKRTTRYNADGFAVENTNGAGETTVFQRDAMQRVVAQQLADGGVTTFMHDARGDIVEAASPALRVQWLRDELGRVVREIEGEHWVATSYDALGRIVRTENDLGPAVDYQLDANGNQLRMQTAGRAVIFERNAYGYELARSMPGGVRLEQGFDACGRLVAQRVLSSATARSADASSRGGNHEVLRRTYANASNDNIERIDDSWSGWTAYAYDPADRLIAALRQRGTSERFSYDAAGNVVRMQREDHAPTDDVLVIGPGNRLLQKGGTRYEYDADGRRSARIDHWGTTAATIWRYEWDSLGRLMAVTRDAEPVVSFKYDAFSRRIEKRRADGTSTRFVWNLDVLLHEINADGLRSWIFEDESFAPMACVQDGRLISVLCDSIGTPIYTVDDSGHVAAAASRLAWGRETAGGASTGAAGALAFPGQFVDPETGLHYNWFRYYDPDTASYISPDPIRTDAGFNFYAYTRNPINWFDPWGLSDCPKKREEYLGRTPGKKSRTGREVIERMRAEGKIIGTGKKMKFQSSDGNWYPIADADMAHRRDAVAYWNKSGYKHGKKSEQVRKWMLDSDNYELEHYSSNRSKGASLGQTYRDPA